MTSIVELIREFNTGRDGDGLRLKLAKLRQDPFVFLRGTCHAFYSRLPHPELLAGDPTGWVCGDLHLENFGSYRADDGRPHFDINDFDEATLAPLSWDVVRLLTSLRLACRVNAPSLSMADVDLLCDRTLAIYVHELVAAHPRWLAHETATAPVQTLLKTVQTRSSLALVTARTQVRRGQHRLKLDGSKLLPATDEQRAAVQRLLGKRAVREGPLGAVEVVDVARRLMGTGSLGLPRFLVLVHRPGDCSEPHRHPHNHPHLHLLDLKAASPSSLPVRQPPWKSEAMRIATLQARLQAVPMGWLTAVGGARQSWVVRRLQASEDRLPMASTLNGKSGLITTHGDLARLAAWAHLRAAGRKGADSVDSLSHLAARRGAKWQRDWLRAAQLAAAQVEKDWQAYTKACNRGAFADWLKAPT